MDNQKKKPEDDSLAPKMLRADTKKAATGLAVAPEMTPPVQTPPEEVEAPKLATEPQQEPSLGQPALPESVLGTDVAPGQAIPPEKMKQAEHLAENPHAEEMFRGKQEFHNTMRDLGEQESLNRGNMIALDPQDPNFRSKLANYQTQAGLLREQKAHFQQSHPWGSMVSAHPGLGGKIGHAFGVMGNIAGNALIPGVMPSIPGSRANLQMEANRGAAEEAAGEEAAGKAAMTAATQAEVPLRQAQTKEALANAEAKGQDKVGTTPEAVTLHDLMTGDNGNPRINPQTGKPFTYLEAYQQVKESTPSATDKPLGTKVNSLNQALTRRWQVLNPGQPLPAEYTLPPEATTKDFDRIDKVLGQNESAIGTQAQRDIANEARRQTQELARQNAQDREEQRGLKWVTWTDPTGHPVAGSLSEGKAAGATGMAELPAQEVRDVQNARHVVRLMTKIGDPKAPETNGLLQLIDALDKDGKLGILASRWNRFLTSGVGTSPGDDPRIVTLINKNMLSDTGTMLAHFGASGGRSPQMLQHFLDLMNAGTMDGVTLRAGARAIEDYMHDRAMLPATKQEGVSANSSGKAVSLAAARQLPQNKGKSDADIRKDIEAHGHRVTE